MTQYILTTDRCEELTTWISEFLVRGFGPTTREAAKAWKTTPQTANTWLDELENRGYIIRLRDDRNKAISRQIQINPDGGNDDKEQAS